MLQHVKTQRPLVMLRQPEHDRARDLALFARSLFTQPPAKPTCAKGLRNHREHHPLSPIATCFPILRPNGRSGLPPGAWPQNVRKVTMASVWPHLPCFDTSPRATFTNTRKRALETHIAAKAPFAAANAAAPTDVGGRGSRRITHAHHITHARRDMHCPPCRPSVLHPRPPRHSQQQRPASEAFADNAATNTHCPPMSTHAKAMAHGEEKTVPDQIGIHRNRFCLQEAGRPPLHQCSFLAGSPARPQQTEKKPCQHNRGARPTTNEKKGSGTSTHCKSAQIRSCQPLRTANNVRVCGKITPGRLGSQA